MTKQTHKYPEHEKLNKVHKLSNNIGSFLDWLIHQKGVKLYLSVNKLPTNTHVDESYVRIGAVPMLYKPNELLAEYFNIDLKKLEEEKQAMLIEIRKLSEKERT